MLRILGKRQSINVRKVLWACDEIGLAHAQEDWGAGHRSTAEPVFQALNPKSLVPVIVDGELVLSESNTIVRYLAARHGRSDLLPADPAGRARVEELMDWQATELNWSWRVAFQVIVRGNAAAGSPEQVARSLAEWERQMLVLEHRLAASGPYVLGETFTAADIVLGLSVNRWFQTPFRKPQLKEVESYFQRLMARPAASGHIGGMTD